MPKRPPRAGCRRPTAASASIGSSKTGAGGGGLTGASRSISPSRTPSSSSVAATGSGPPAAPESRHGTGCQPWPRARRRAPAASAPDRRPGRRPAARRRPRVRGASTVSRQNVRPGHHGAPHFCSRNHARDFVQTAPGPPGRCLASQAPDGRHGAVRTELVRSPGRRHRWRRWNCAGRARKQPASARRRARAGGAAGAGAGGAGRDAGAADAADDAGRRGRVHRVLGPRTRRLAVRRHVRALHPRHARRPDAGRGGGARHRRHRRGPPRLPALPRHGAAHGCGRSPREQRETRGGRAPGAGGVARGARRRPAVGAPPGRRRLRARADRAGARSGWPRGSSRRRRGRSRASSRSRRRVAAVPAGPLRGARPAGRPVVAGQLHRLAGAGRPGGDLGPRGRWPGRSSRSTRCGTARPRPCWPWSRHRPLHRRGSGRSGCRTPSTRAGATPSARCG